MTAFNAKTITWIKNAIGDSTHATRLIEALGIGDASFSIADEDTNAIVVSVQLKDYLGRELTARTSVKVLVLADANGDAFESADYTIAAGTDGAVVQSVADNVLECITEADGDLDISLTITGGETCYLAVVLSDGSLKISGAITHAA